MGRVGSTHITGTHQAAALLQRQRVCIVVMQLLLSMDGSKYKQEQPLIGLPSGCQNIVKI
jgi:hypothetical protein